ncbi:MAG: hypothetical protein WA323_11540 [Candidatus Nitrosopolaris sp.]
MYNEYENKCSIQHHSYFGSSITAGPVVATPCCHYRLRTGPRNTKYKLKKRIKTKESEAAPLP